MREYNRYFIQFGSRYFIGVAVQKSNHFFAIHYFNPNQILKTQDENPKKSIKNKTKLIK
jgi:hypothetical protein